MLKHVQSIVNMLFRCELLVILSGTLSAWAQVSSETSLTTPPQMIKMPQKTGFAAVKALPQVEAREAAPEPVPFPQLQILLPECAAIASSVSSSVSQSVLTSAMSIANISLSQTVAAVRSSAQSEIAAASVSAANAAVGLL